MLFGDLLIFYFFGSYFCFCFAASPTQMRHTLNLLRMHPYAALCGRECAVLAVDVLLYERVANGNRKG